ncbi:MAG: glycogen synthase GlgA [bacterium]|nr:glycogen synthase GlgA [bacterium]
MRILEVASEVAPFARTGGLGDVLGSLPKALSKQGHEVKVFMPKFGSIDSKQFSLRPLDRTLKVKAFGEEIPFSLEMHHDGRQKVDHYFVVQPQYFGRPSFYLDPATGKDYPDNDDRFNFFCRAVLGSLATLNWRPDIIHLHDWQTALIPALLKYPFANDSWVGQAKTVLTIHNLGYQGTFPASRFTRLELPEKLFYAMTGPFEFFGKVNFLKAGIILADKLTTVSKQYATEIQTTEEYGYGLEGVLTERTKDLSGILNGVDYTIWSPSRDRLLPYKYTLSNLTGKRENKVELLRFAKLPLRPSAPLIGMISRLADQKGWDLIEKAAEELFTLNIQMIVLGTGDKKYVDLLKKLEKQHPDKLRAFITFDDALAHRIEAASDIFLMPSRWEPCGLNQLYSLKYGTVPVVRKVGGLADTVVDWDPKKETGTGFLFEEYDADAMLTAIRRAVELFSRKRTWTKLVKSGMEQDFSWESSAQSYGRLFEALAAK